ncbi:DUF1080 domain-containing protein [Paludisphaera sp.]|uniref:3-keto-disaccharide hydrolase n=1 Tax=Paludisphaera sp. TaxID=2017432 RepID=UPI00301D287D
MMIRRAWRVAATLSLTFALFGARSAMSEEWRALFDGKSLDGWEHVGPGQFVVEDGTLKTEGGMGLLWYTREKLGDCVIRVVYRGHAERANSGVYVRIADKPADPWFAVHNGFEVQVLDAGSPGGSTGAVYTFAPSQNRPARPLGWNTLEITLKGDRITTRLNDVPVADFDSSTLTDDAETKEGPGDPSRRPRPQAGYIGLQNHDDKSIVSYKEISVRPLAE